MRKLAVCAVAVAAALWYASAGRSPRPLRPDLRDAPASSDFRDLAQLHERPDAPGDTCVWCHAARALQARDAARDSSRWLASTAPMSPGGPTGVSSAVCLSCHDGALAGAARDYAPEPGLGVTGLPSPSHPIGMAYASVAARKPKEYRSAFEAGVVLEDGKVGCASCHVGHRGERRPAGHAAVAQGLCQNCHRY